MGKKQLQAWGLGDVFLVQTKDGMNVVGQIVAQERQALNSVTCAFFDIRVRDEREVKALSVLPTDRVFSILFVSRDLLDRGVWRVVGRLPVAIPQDQLPYEHLRAKGWVGATVTGSGIVSKFLNAYYALAPWDDWKDPAYLDRLLVSPDKKPVRLILKGQKEENGPS
jgi:hypothetical protein